MLAMLTNEAEAASCGCRGASYGANKVQTNEKAKTRERGGSGPPTESAAARSRRRNRARGLRQRRPHSAHRHSGARRIARELQSRRARAPLGCRRQECRRHLAALTLVDGAKVQAGALRLRQEVFRPRRLGAGSIACGAGADQRSRRRGERCGRNSRMAHRRAGAAARASENLLDNAVKFTDRGSVQLEARAAHAARGRVKLQLTVSDSGIGLKASEIKRLFCPFAQANPEPRAATAAPGSGLIVCQAIGQANERRPCYRQQPGQRLVFLCSPTCCRSRRRTPAQENHVRRFSSARRRIRTSSGPRITPMAASFSTPSPPSLVIAPPRACKFRNSLDYRLSARRTSSLLHTPYSYRTRSD